MPQLSNNSWIFCFFYSLVSLFLVSVTLNFNKNFCSNSSLTSYSFFNTFYLM